MNNPISEVYNRDCVAFMKELPDKFFALAIADPPYGINAANMSNTQSMRNRLQQGAGKLKDRILQTAKKDWDFFPPSQEFFDEMFRVCENMVIWGGNYFPLPPTRCIVAWDKCQPWENFSQIEIAWTSFDYPAKLYKFDNRTNDKIHPTQKPIDLYAWCLRTFAKEGDKIFDPMMGSQSSRIAAYKLGFDYWGCELDKDYFDAGNERFASECLGETKMKSGKIVKQLTLF